MLATSRVWAQAGPPFQTDDPTPVALGHYEAYIFGGVGGTPVEIDPFGPAFEFNWGPFVTCNFMQSCPLGLFCHRITLSMLRVGKASARLAWLIWNWA
jgi:hypothetical protein